MALTHIASKLAQEVMAQNGLVELKIPQRTLGKTNLKVSILSVGGLGSTEKQDKEESIEIFQRAYSLGINYYDTASGYGGPSEEFIGEAVQKFRKNIIIATKTDDYTRDGALRLLEQSLKRLRTDYLDIWQLHHVEKMKDVNTITGNNGALKALTEMREQGVVRFLGYTGHDKPEVLTEMNKRFNFDTALCAVNAADVHVNPSIIKTFLPVAKKSNLGIIGMKSLGQGYVFHPKGLTTTWEALMYAFSLPVSTVIVGHDSVAQLEENAAIARSFIQLTPAQMKAIEEKTKKYPRRACFYRSNYGGYDSKNELGPPFKI